jgi:metal-responsive CopG/Arc/MetJ family transcriptional regulator
MLAVRIDDELINEIDDLAKKQHKSRSSIVREAIIRFLEDFDDIQAAEFSERHTTSVKSLEEIRKDLELDR